MADKFLKFLKEANETIIMIADAKKENKGDKEVMKWHTRLDGILHKFVGESGKTAEEKKKDV